MFTICTKESLPALFEFIADRNKLYKCLILGTTTAQVQDDFENFEIDISTFYLKLEGGEIIGAIGIQPDKHIYGPWVSETHSLKVLGQELLDYVLAIAKDLKYDSVGPYVDGTATETIELFKRNGFKIEKQEYGMKCTKNNIIQIDTNSDLECRLIDPHNPESKDALAIHLECFSPINFNASNWDEKMSNAKYLLFGCFKDQRLISYAIVLKQEVELYVYYLGTSKDSRKIGSATKLMVTIREWFTNSVFEKIVLNVGITKQEAKTLYEKVGFRTINDHLIFCLY